MSKNTSQTKIYPFNKDRFRESLKKPTWKIRLMNLRAGIKSLIDLVKEPVVNEYVHYPLVFVWGEDPHSNLYTHNAISIIYNMEEKMFYLKIETAVSMSSDEMWGQYLLETFEMFTEFMRQNGLNEYAQKDMFMAEPKIELKARTIEELYTEYRMFVNAYISTFDLFPEEEEECEEEFDDDFGEDDDDDDLII